jgi:hypothetical protein
MRTLMVLLLAIACVAPAAHAQDFAFGFNPRTGDAWFDACLGDINVWAAGDLHGYVDEVVVTTGAPRYYVEELVIERRYPPADVWMIAEVARVSGQSFASVADTYAANRGRGWGVMAQRLGIEPGSAAFHALKARTGKQRDSWKAKGPPVHAARASAAGGAQAAPPGHAKAKGAAPPGHAKAKAKAKGKGKGPGGD